MTAICGAATITGAASGIGHALAIELAQRGCDLALADRDEAGLRTLAAEIGKGTDNGRKVSVHRVDVSEPGNIAQFATDAIAAPKDAALRIIQGIERNEPRILIGKRRPLHGYLAALPPGDLLGAVAAEAGEDGEGDVTSGARLSHHIFPLSFPAEAGNPVRRGFSVRSLPPLGYWIARLRG